jgi:hypothetical protein
MKSMALLLTVVILSACSTVVPVKQKFPNVPPELMKNCPELTQLLPTETAITDLLRAVVKNYATYYECSARRDGWQDWYSEQRKIFESATR